MAKIKARRYYAIVVDLDKHDTAEELTSSVACLLTLLEFLNGATKWSFALDDSYGECDDPRYEPETNFGLLEVPE